MEELLLIPQLYRQEYSKMVSLLCSRFGIDQIDAAEDIVSETFLSAAETWGMKGMPDNPVAWLYRVAKNNVLNELKHERVFRKQVKGELIQNTSISAEPEFDISRQKINDSQLQMIFAVCHPSIPIEAQVSLALRVLCGFSIDEIAQALLTTKTNINKRLYRAKEKLRLENIKFPLLDNTALNERLDAVLITLYLLFNEGYYSASPDKVLRKDLCVEAMRLVYLLTEYHDAKGATIASQNVYALLALMCFQASRFDARMSSEGDLILYEQQDNSLWDMELINRGNNFFIQSCDKGMLSRYHFEAAIAWWHTHQANSKEKWENILMLYNRLLVLEYTPIAALNRAYAFARVYGNEKAIHEAEGLNLEGNLFYHSLLGELYTGLINEKAIYHFEKALTLTETIAEKAVILEKLNSCKCR
ncbi:MAG TPA: sigma-70 family RNA polymerase sigma factor [Flavipsychrobacter sp.]|nr:sigma-70 family RNA polymerase sigma factor [Flavipsychrobacter sp.]